MVWKGSWAACPVESLVSCSLGVFGAGRAASLRFHHGLKPQLLTTGSLWVGSWSRLHEGQEEAARKAWLD